MRNSVDEQKKYLTTMLEQLHEGRPWLAQELQKNKLFYLYASVLYAAEDAVNLAFSYFSLIFALKDAAEEHSDSQSAREWHLYEITPEGIVITVVSSLLLLLFSSLATYYADVDYNDNPAMYFLANAWSYVRDILKVFKWAYKGIRSTLSIILQFAGSNPALLYHILFPITLAFGILAIINRVLIRNMRAERKKNQLANEELCQKLSEKSSALIKKSKLPEKPQDKLAYANTLIYLNNETMKAVYWGEENADGEVSFVAVPIDDMDAFDKKYQTVLSENVCKKMKVYLDEEKKLESIDGIGQKTRVLYFLKGLPVFSEDENEVDVHFLLLPFDLGDIEKIRDELLKNIANPQIKQIHTKLQEYSDFTRQAFNADEMRTLKKILQDILPQLFQKMSSYGINLTFNHHILLSPKYAEDIIYVDNLTWKAHQKLHVVDKLGVAAPSPEMSIEFEQRLNEERKKRQVMCIAPEQIDRLIPGFTTDRRIGYTYKQWLEYKRTVDYTKQNGLALYLFAAVIFGAIIDGLYYYMGTLFVSSLIPHLFIALFCMSALLFVICLISRVYEEYDFQRKFDVSQLKVEVAKCEAELKILENKLATVDADANISFAAIKELRSKLLIDLQQYEESADVEFLTDESQDEIEPDQALLIDHFLIQLIKYEKLQQALEDKMVYSIYSATCQGMRNGLAIQGIIASFMFFVIAIMLLNGGSVSGIFVLSFLSVSMLGLAVSLAQFIISYQVYKNNLDLAKRQRTPFDWLTAYENADSCQAKSDVLLKAVNNLDQQKSKAIPDFFVIEWCEVIRLFFSGYIKAGKTVGEVTYDPDHIGRESWVMFTVSVVFSLIVGVIFALRAVNKMFNQKPEPMLGSLEEVTSSDKENAHAKSLFAGQTIWSKFSRDPSPSPIIKRNYFLSCDELNKKLKPLAEFADQQMENSLMELNDINVYPIEVPLRHC